MLTLKKPIAMAVAITMVLASAPRVQADDHRDDRRGGERRVEERHVEERHVETVHDHHIYGHDYEHYRHRDHHDDTGAVIGAAAVALVGGVAIGSALSQPAPQPQPYY